MEKLRAKIDAIRNEGLEEIRQAPSLNELEEKKTVLLGRKGKLRKLMTLLPQLSAADKPEAGRLLNVLKQELTEAIETHMNTLGDTGDTSKKKSAPIFDRTLPGLKRQVGRKHPLTQTLDELKSIFGKLGFEVAEGREIEVEYYNFEALNIQPDHPSRDDFDTFFLTNDKYLLRSHTSPVQVHYMETHEPPLRVIAPGRVYRPDAPDARHFYVFHQLEGLVVDKDVSFRDLKAVLGIFVREMFGRKTKTRFKPSYFPFTEPSAEMDISCIFCGGDGCRVCGHAGWIEILGAGMVDPNVFKAVKYDTEEYAGFAFGMGIERICMMRYEIDDIRLFFENDLRFLEQF